MCSATSPRAPFSSPNPPIPGEVGSSRDGNPPIPGEVGSSRDGNPPIPGEVGSPRDGNPPIPGEVGSPRDGNTPLLDEGGSTSGGSRPLSDLTARARIRDVAVGLFASRGYRGTTIRDVAAEAGVSPGLVQHHFGAKEGLREACDQHLAETLRAIMASQTPRSHWDRDLVAEMYDTGGPAMRYLARGLLEGWPGVSKVFDEGVLGTAQWLTESWPDRYEAESEKTRMHAAVMTTLSLGVVALHHHLGRWLGVDPLDAAHLHVTDSALVEIIPLMAEYLASEEGLAMRNALAEYERDMESSGKKDDHE
jgi:TetR/AcrR family transcriptional regulator, regulator of cefoperazone and chloramphenicol sensitivity